MAQDKTTPAPPSIEWRWDQLAPPEWACLLAQAPLPTLEQCWAHGAGIEHVSSYRAHRGVAYRGDQPIAMVQLFRRAIGPLAIGKILRGPVLLAPLPHDALVPLLQPIADEWRIRRLRPLFWLPEAPVGDGAMRLLGKRPMVIGNATARIDLAPDEDALREQLDGKWRNQLTRAERGKMRVQIDHGGRMLDWLLGKHEAFRRKERHRGPSHREIKAMVDALDMKEDALVLTALDHNEPLAGILVLIHGKGATYHVAWAGADGRRVHAHNLLLWRGMLAAKKRGAAFLDLGGLDATAPGVARFKLGTGAAVAPLAATYL
ncbi:MAG: GNAT family N-acetyltransferase [Alphaproteobacteria bacterium]|nr:GNAT family N-acetyltransferase [Alphaproteobacteria bacterium]